MKFLNLFLDWFSEIDWIIVGAIVPILFFGLITMNSFDSRNLFFDRQLVWIGISFCLFMILSLIDFKFLRRTSVVVTLYFLSIATLLVLFFVGSIFSGAQSWLDFGFFSIQPAEFSKLILVITLAKYFSRRHVEIRNFKHLIVSGAYAFILFGLIMVQPDFGSALIIFFIWLGMVWVSGLSKKHLAFVFMTGLTAFLALWFFVLADYQKNRIMTFVNPLEDIQGAGYNAYQAMETVGSGQFLGKGVGYGTQSRLSFLPEYQTDFIFAAFAEEWGFLGALILFICYGVLFFRIISISTKGATNFETLFALGVAIMFMSHFVVHVGMNIGLMPITGLTLPFMSYGGTNMLMSFVSLGILMSMKKYSRTSRRDISRNEFVGLN
jgi:rod shape determining protein RodA